MLDIAIIVGERVRHYRNKAGFSQDELAQKAGLHYTYIGQIERGEKNATLESIAKIAYALQVPLEVLFENIVTGNTDNPFASEAYSLISSLPLTEQKMLLDLIKQIIAYKNS
ncbi:transcriptional regulator [Clostridium thermosuccinogenes]|uniref:Transcriptional regulator n=1 Tax=Clostridium thermosuccinogenes TaxID=84032 RepID=A0A2K2EZE0_9CLOT|nr:helix-turn-helix transcriptional regulator [Pseudoclostridium thermosuccinogenes]AUS98015.1 transcriptional regulator [Pseudoclostridium thermosuccinogenes]PNT91889.1 transcriptional regulator [Pseudoclostridium thermosuccinogenes]PNT94676.1 transcriptional regulator [Pseudoclostridium thermosuccinogenes]